MAAPANAIRKKEVATALPMVSGKAMVKLVIMAIMKASAIVATAIMARARECFLFNSIFDTIIQITETMLNAKTIFMLYTPYF